jgi:hypothetical protein
MNKKQDKIGEEGAGDIWKPKLRYVSVKRAHKHYNNMNAAKTKTYTRKLIIPSSKEI